MRNGPGAELSLIHIYKDLKEYTAVYTTAFLEDCAALRLERPEHLVPATDPVSYTHLDVYKRQSR